MGKNGITYFWCGGIAVFLSWALSGCYIGNKEVDAPYNGPWYYETQLSNIRLCAAINGEAAVCQNTILSSNLPTFGIPTATGNLDFSQVSDPLILSEIDPADVAADGANYLVSDSNNGTPYFVFNANVSPTPTSPISYSTSTQMAVFYDVSNGDNPTCVMDTTVQIAGNLTNSGPFNTYTANPLSGRMVFTLTITMTPDPVINTGCAQAVECYDNPLSDCQGVSSDAIQSVFSNFAGPGGPISLAAVNGVYPTVNSLSYTIQYQ